MKGLLRFFFLVALAVGLSTLASVASRRWWALLPFAEYEAECGLASGSIVQGRTYYDFAEDRQNPTRLRELRERVNILREDDLFDQRVLVSCLTNAVARSIDTNELVQIISTASVEVVPRRTSVLVRMRGRDAASVSMLVEVYASEIEGCARSSDRERLGRVVEQLTRNLQRQAAVVAKIEKRMKIVEKLSTEAGSNETARLSAELGTARAVRESMSAQLSNTKISISRGEMGSFVRVAQKAEDAKLVVPNFWTIWWCVFPAVIVIVLISCCRCLLGRAEMMIKLEGATPAHTESRTPCGAG